MQCFKTSKQKAKISSNINVDINKASRMLMFILISTLEVLWPSFWHQKFSTSYFSDSISSCRKGNKNKLNDFLWPYYVFAYLNNLQYENYSYGITHMTELHVC